MKKNDLTRMLIYRAKIEGFWSAMMSVLLILWNVGNWSTEDLENLIDRMMDLSIALQENNKAVIDLIKEFTEDTGIIITEDDVAEKRKRGKQDE